MYMYLSSPDRALSRRTSDAASHTRDDIQLRPLTTKYMGLLPALLHISADEIPAFLDRQRGIINRTNFGLVDSWLTDGPRVPGSTSRNPMPLATIPPTTLPPTTLPPTTLLQRTLPLATPQRRIAKQSRRSVLPSSAKRTCVPLRRLRARPRRAERRSNDQSLSLLAKSVPSPPSRPS
jgi:hypothetical protein